MGPYDRYKWNKWGEITPVTHVFSAIYRCYTVTPFITGRGPPCMRGKQFVSYFDPELLLLDKKGTVNTDLLMLPFLWFMSDCLRGPEKTNYHRFLDLLVNGAWNISKTTFSLNGGEV